MQISRLSGRNVLAPVANMTTSQAEVSKPTAKLSFGIDRILADQEPVAASASRCVDIDLSKGKYHANLYQDAFRKVRIKHD